MKNMGLFVKMTLPAIIVAVLVAVGVATMAKKQQASLATSQARLAAKAIGQQVLAERAMYTQHVISKPKKDGVEFKPSQTPETTPGGVPLPATFVHRVSAAVVANPNATHSVDLLSTWNLNPNKGPRDAFEKEGLTKVAANPNQIYDGIEGTGAQARYRAIIADIGTADACINCHNNHEKSTKRDFKLNDVMGGIVVSVPVGEAMEQASGNVTTLIVLFVSGIIILIVTQTIFQWLLVTKPLGADLAGLENAAERISTGELDQPVPPGSTGETNRLAAAFDRMRLSLRAAVESTGMSTHGDDDI